MWRVLGVIAIVSAIWGAGAVIPTSDEAANVAVAVGIATQGNPKPEAAAAALYAPVAPAAADPDGSSGPAESTDSATRTATIVQPAAGAATSEPPVDEAGRLELVMALQRELRRVGCYHGRITGSWSRSTRKAAAAFAERLDMSRPENPDSALLKVAARFQDRACGAPCAIGQRPNANGRCKSIEIVADAAPTAPGGDWQTTVTVTTEDAAPTKPQTASAVAQAGAADAGEGPIVVASLGEPAASAETATASQEASEPDALPTLKATRKQRNAKKRLPADAFAPVSDSGSLADGAVPQPASALSGKRKRTVIGSLGAQPAVLKVSKASRKRLHSAAFGLGVSSPKRIRAASRAASVRAGRREGFAASLRNRMRQQNGGSLR